MKHLLVVLAIITPTFLFAQIPNINPRNIKILYQTTGKGTVWHGNDTINYTPLTDGNAWLHLDTVNNKLYSYVQNQWKLVTAGGVESFYTNGDTLFLETADTTFYVLSPVQGLDLDSVSTNKVKLDITGSTQDVYIQGGTNIQLQKQQDTLLINSPTSVSISEVDLPAGVFVIADNQNTVVWDGINVIGIISNSNKKRITLTVNGQSASFEVCKCE